MTRARNFFPGRGHIAFPTRWDYLAAAERLEALGFTERAERWRSVYRRLAWVPHSLDRVGCHSSQESRATLPDAPRIMASGASGAAGAGRPHHAPAAPQEAPV
jgi:hypothetical protein